MVISGVIAAVGLSLPYLVVPIRRSMGLPTYQWDSDTNTNPVRLFALVHAPSLFYPGFLYFWAAPLLNFIFFFAMVTGPFSKQTPSPTPPLPCRVCPSQFISEHSSALKKHEFNDAKLLAAWSKDSKYRYHDKLEKSHAEFP